MSAVHNHPFLPLKLYFLFYFAAQLTQLFLPLILDQVMNFSLTTIGALMASRRLVLSFTAPIFTVLCDQTYRHREILTFAHIAYYASSALLASLRSLPAVTVIIILREAFVSGCEPLLNNAVLALINDHSNQNQGAAFGSFRLYGSLGWGLSSTIGPLIADKFFNGDLITLLYVQVAIGIPVVILVMYSVDLSPALFRRQATRLAENQLESGTEQTSESLSSGFSSLSPLAIHAGLVAVMQGVTLGALQTTSFIYFSSIPISPSALGIAVTLSCAAEAVLFLFDVSAIEMIGGTGPAFLWSAVANAFSLILYTIVAFTPYPAITFMLVEVFCGAAHALFLSSALDVAAGLAPPDRASTAQGTLSALLYGFGPAIGSFIAGMCYDRIGAPATYLTLSAAQLLVALAPKLMGYDLYASISNQSIESNEAEPLLPSSGDMVKDLPAVTKKMQCLEKSEERMKISSLD